LKPWKPKTPHELEAMTEAFKRMTPKRPERIGAIYVIKIGDLYKIGNSLTPEQRIANMQLPGKPDVVLIFRCRKWVQLEGTLHKKYAAHREHGEWFRLTKPQIAEIHKVCEAWKKEVGD
jgi:hypothetical protein